MNQKPEIYEWDYDGSYDPQKAMFHSNAFSMGIFQWIPKKSGNGLKRSKAIYRIRGYVSNPDEVYQKAQKSINILNSKFKNEKGFAEENESI